MRNLLTLFHIRSSHQRWLIIATLVFVLVGGKSYGQEEEELGLRKNVFQITGGTIVFYSAWNVNYERMLVEFDDNVINSLWLKVGAGQWNDGWAGKGPHWLGGLNILLFNGKHHIELGLGLVSRFEKDSYDNWIAEGKINPNFNEKSDFWQSGAAGGIGWRVQKPNGNFILRMGLGFPETAYLGLGYSFGS